MLAGWGVRLQVLVLLFGFRRHVCCFFSEGLRTFSGLHGACIGTLPTGSSHDSTNSFTFLVASLLFIFLSYLYLPEDGIILFRLVLAISDGGLAINCRPGIVDLSITIAFSISLL